MILAQHYVRRCRECLQEVTPIQLPILRKRIVYVDQFAISDMMKALNPATAAHRNRRVAPCWLELFRKLDRLTKLQLIICPDSQFHRMESEAAPFFEELRRLYELLSGGLTFRDSGYIEQCQIRESFEQWLSGRTEHIFDLDIAQVGHGNVHGRRERFTLSWNSRTPQDVIDGRRRRRNAATQEFAHLFRDWQEDPLSFEERVAVEVKGYGEGLLQVYQAYLNRYARIAAGVEAFSLESVLPPNAGMIFLLLRNVLSKRGYSDRGTMQKALDYLISDAMLMVPFLKIRSRLFAALARRVAAGRRRLPGQGFITDVTMVSLLLPYCDAILVDTEIAGLAREAGLPKAAVPSAKIFSPKTVTDFMEYLSTIEGACTPEHRQLIEAVYGPKGAEPFETVFASGASTR